MTEATEHGFVFVLGDLLLLLLLLLRYIVVLR